MRRAASDIVQRLGRGDEVLHIAAINQFNWCLCDIVAKPSIIGLDNGGRTRIFWEISEL
jgi:hypothetical protein